MGSGIQGTRSTDFAEPPIVPWPPPWRRGRRWAAAGVVAILMVIALWFAWRERESRTLQAEMAATLARHEPLYLSDFTVERIADDQNAAILYRAAAAEAVANANIQPSISLGSMPRIGRGAEIVIYAKMMTMIWEARRMPHLDWRYNPDTPLLARSPWSERAIDGLPRRVLDLADAWYRENDDTTALQCGYDALRLIEAMSTTGRADARANALSNEGNLLAQIEGIFCRANSSGVPRVLVFPVGAQGRDIFQRFTSELCDDSHERRVTHLAILQARAVDSSLTLLRRLRAPLLGPWIDHSIALRLLDYRSELACSDQPGLALSVPVSSGPAFPAQPINLLLLQPADPYVSQLVMDTRHIIRIRHQMAANLGALNCFSYDEAPALQGLASLLPPATQPSPGPAWPGSDRSILSAYDLPVAPPATMPSLDRFAPEVKAYEDELRDQLGVPAQRDRIAAEVEAYEQMKRGLNQPVPLNGVNVPNTFHGDLPATASPTSPATDR